MKQALQIAQQYGTFLTGRRDMEKKEKRAERTIENLVQRIAAIDDSSMVRNRQHLSREQHVLDYAFAMICASGGSRDCRPALFESLRAALTPQRFHSRFDSQQTTIGSRAKEVVLDGWGAITRGCSKRNCTHFAVRFAWLFPLQVVVEQLILASQHPEAPDAEVAKSSLLLSLDPPSRHDLHSKLMDTATSLYKFMQLGSSKLGANCRYVSQWTNVMIQVSVSLGGGGARGQNAAPPSVARAQTLLVVRSVRPCRIAAHSIGDWLGRLPDCNV